MLAASLAVSTHAPIRPLLSLHCFYDVSSMLMTSVNLRLNISEDISLEFIILPSSWDKSSRPVTLDRRHGESVWKEFPGVERYDQNICKIFKEEIVKGPSKNSCLARHGGIHF